MKNALQIIFFVSFYILCVITTPAQSFPWQDFKSRTLKDVAAMEKDVEKQFADGKTKPVVFHGDMLLTRARVVYTGLTRPISEAKKQFLRQWAEMFTQDKETYGKLYETDLLFTEDGVEYWLPVQKQVIPYFEKELKKGDELDLYIVRAGGLYEQSKDKNKWDWLWLVEEFQKPK